jgi:hypothetical protein
MEDGSQVRDGAVDEKTLFAALQGELNSRAQARAAINTTHIQTIMVFTGGYLAARVTGEATNGSIALVISTLFPLASAYFVSLYGHNDTLIGSLNRSLRKLEEKGSVELALRYYDVGATGRNLNARRSSHVAVMLLCATCPFLLGLEYMFSWLDDFKIPPLPDRKTWAAFIIIGCVTAANILRLINLNRKRAKLMKS